MFEDAALRRRDVPINTRVDLVAEHTRLNAELQRLLEADAAQPARPQRLGDQPKTSPEVLHATEAVETVERAMDDSWVTLTLQQFPTPKWLDWKSKNPPMGGIDDEYLGVNTAALVDELLPEAVVAPELTEADWDRALNKGGMFPADVKMLAYQVVAMHEVGFVVPKSRLVLAVRQTFDEQSEQLADSASLSDGSAGGNRPKGTTTSTRLGKQSVTQS